MNTRKKPERLTPGQVVNQVLGMTAIARECALSESTVWRWAQARPRGTGGLIPPRYHVPLLQLAAKAGKSLTADDLVYGRPR